MDGLDERGSRKVNEEKKVEEKKKFEIASAAAHSVKMGTQTDRQTDRQTALTIVFFDQFVDTLFSFLCTWLFHLNLEYAPPSPSTKQGRSISYSHLIPTFKVIARLDLILNFPFLTPDFLFLLHFPFSNTAAAASQTNEW